ncbi:hypothetical protein GCM10027168_63440 [Streptomyces capparidis]
MPHSRFLRVARRLVMSLAPRREGRGASAADMAGGRYPPPAGCGDSSFSRQAQSATAAQVSPRSAACRSRASALAWSPASSRITAGVRRVVVRGHPLPAAPSPRRGPLRPRPER